MLATAIPATPRRNRTQTSGESAPRRDGEDMEGLALPPRYPLLFLDYRPRYARDPRIEKRIAMGEELRRMFMEKFGQCIIDKYRPTAIT